jgi:threonyl-tRNA synthetase
VIQITFPDGNQKSFEVGVSAEHIAGSISSGLKKNAVAALVNHELYDYNRPILQDASISLITKDHPKAFEVLNHSSAHLLAQAVKALFPKASFGVGPSIDEMPHNEIE